MLAADKLHADEVFRYVYWIGETALPEHRAGDPRPGHKAARQHHVKTMLSGSEVTTVKHWLSWSARAQVGES